MKVTYRIPTEMYAYVEVEKDYQEAPSPDTIREHYNELMTAFKVQPSNGIPVKEFNAALDRYLSDGTGETEVYLKMSPAQQAVFQEIKKAFKRLDAKELKANGGHNGRGQM